MPFDNLLVERDGRVAILTINRPSVLNALNAATLDDLRRALLDCRHDDAVRAIVITGSGNKAFAAGADIGELASQTALQNKDLAARGQHVFDLIENMGKPVIAAINGYALGGGCELAMACTLRMAADSATLGQPEVNLGLTPGYGGTQRLPRLVGKGVALDLLLTGRQISAGEALGIGLVNRVVPGPELLAQAKQWAQDLATKAPVAVRLIIEAVNRGSELTLDRGAFLESTLFGLASSSEDMREGTTAFLQKRKPEFKGR